MTAEEHEAKQWDELNLKIVDMNVDDAKMVRALKRQPNWVLQKLRIERNNISSPKTNKAGEERGQTRNNGYGSNQNNGHNRGNNGKYGSGNGGGRNINNHNHNGNNNGSGNNAVEQVKSNYQLRNRNVNNEQGKPAGIFAKVTKSGGTNNNAAKGKDANSGAAMNIMPEDVRRELRMHVDTPYGKYYAMDNRSVLVVGIMKDVEFGFPACLATTYKTNITVVQVPANYEILLSRQWSNLVGGHIQLDLSYATIPVEGTAVRINREEVALDEATCFCHSDMDNFQIGQARTMVGFSACINVKDSENE
ncbi:uncharacterized protein LOC131859349 [Cryptomeria japonica]|uniref:uncharacterized protein LOC131859349 n=1 Tax=Cryptomeria japonica TaxID=3369 RepID=UPI0027D9E7D6|nr:uncharacterized protein LOC131859349 [Cryptomeria japonica]